MKFNKLVLVSCAVVALSTVASAATVTIEALDVRSNGIFGHDPNVSGVAINAGTGAPVDATLTYSNLDLDGDASANDAVTFTVSFANGSDIHRLFNQGADTGFGNLTDVTVSVTGVSGVTTDSGNPIVFDGFTGAAAGMGAGAPNSRFVDINGTTVNLATTMNSFEFVTAAVDFALTPTVLFDNSGGTAGSIVARHYDLQFSAIPEPTALVLLGTGFLGLIARRREVH